MGKGGRHWMSGWWFGGDTSTISGHLWQIEEENWLVVTGTMEF